jgi:serine/threonine-protein kinase
VLHEQLAGNVDAERRFRREALLANRVDHPAVVPVIDDDVSEDGSVFLVMPLLRGETARARAARSGNVLAVEEVVAIARAVLGALTVAHRAQIVHRDIKPENVFITNEGEVRVLDFGIATVFARAGDASATQSGHAVGTPAFMAPEQALGRARDIDGRTDLWSVGATMFCLLSGRTVHEAETVGESLVYVATRVPRALGEVAPTVPLSVSAVVDRALAREKSDRWPDAASMLVALEEAIDHEKLQVPLRLAPTDTPDGSLAENAGIAAPALVSSGFSLTELLERERTSESGADHLRSRTTATAVSGPGESPWRRLRPATWLTVVAAMLTVLVTAITGLLKIVRPGHEIASSQRDAPPFGNAEAAAAYRAGMQAWHDGALSFAKSQLDRAVELDPTSAVARLRRAALASEAPATAISEDLQVARAGRAALNAHDRLVLDALEPWARSPRDNADAVRRFAAAHAQEPKDADFALLLALALVLDGQITRAEAMCDVAFAEDPTLAAALGLKARSLVAEGRTADATPVYERCIEVSPSATMCLDDLITLQGSNGQCREMEKTVRSRIAIAPTDAGPYERLAEALFTTGASVASVRAALEQSWARNGAARDMDEAVLASLTGDLEGAEQWDIRAEREVAGVQRESVHSFPIFDRLLIVTELGRTKDVVEIVDDYFARRAAWEAGDPSWWWYATIAKRNAGGLTDAEFRSAWVEQGRAFGSSPEVAWFLDSMLPARTPEEAIAALARQPTDWAVVDYPLSPTRVQDLASIGHFYSLAGKPEDALTYLRQATVSCNVFDYFTHIYSTWAAAELGTLLEAKGDTRGACEAYGRVLRRWGAAKPPSTTAERVRRRARVLACPP